MCFADSLPVLVTFSYHYDQIPDQTNLRMCLLWLPDQNSAGRHGWQGTVEGMAWPRVLK